MREITKLIEESFPQKRLIQNVWKDYKVSINESKELLCHKGTVRNISPSTHVIKNWNREETNTLHTLTSKKKKNRKENFSPTFVFLVIKGKKKDKNLCSQCPKKGISPNMLKPHSLLLACRRKAYTIQRWWRTLFVA